MSNRVALDRKGTQLWNQCRKLNWKRTEAEQRSLAQSKCPDFTGEMGLNDKVRALAFYMIESAQERKVLPVPGKCSDSCDLGWIWLIRAKVEPD